MSLMCHHKRSFTLDITFNIRQEDPSSPIKQGQTGHFGRQANGGITEIKFTGFYEFEFSRAPAWEPVVLIQHECVPKGVPFKSIKLLFNHSPALRNKTMYTYKYYMDITDKAGDFNGMAVVTKS